MWDGTNPAVGAHSVPVGGNCPKQKSLKLVPNRRCLGALTQVPFGNAQVAIAGQVRLVVEIEKGTLMDGLL